jgi:putative restriction endonuclease
MSDLDPDEVLRAACFAGLRRLCQQFGDEVPYREGLDAGFRFEGERVPYMNPQKGIYRAAVQRGPAALSIMTSWKSPYDDEPTENGFSYAYRRGNADQPDNRALRAAGEAQAPLAYFIGTRPGWFHPLFPTYVVADHVEGEHVILGVGSAGGDVDAPTPLGDAAPRARRRRPVRCFVAQGSGPSTIVVAPV